MNLGIRKVLSNIDQKDLELFNRPSQESRESGNAEAVESRRDVLVGPGAEDF